MGCGCKKKKEAILNDPIKQPAQDATVVNESTTSTEANQQQIVDSILEKLKQINK
jgi:hypothetical protein